MEGEGIQQMYITKFKFVPPPVFHLLFPDVIWQSDCKKVLLTIDDSPSPDTPRVLDLLDRHKIKAAFFVNVPEIAKKQIILREIASRGHLVANHSLQHKNLRKIPSLLMAYQIVRSKDLLEQILGKEVKFFRPPYGSFDLEVYRKVDESGQRLVMWTLLTGDYSGDEKLATYNVKKYLTQKSIVVMHDNAKSKGVFEVTLETLVNTVAKKQYQFGEPEECLR